MPVITNYQSHNRQNLIADVGVLRIAVAIIVVTFLPVIFFDGQSQSVFGIIATLVVPGLVLFMIWALPFDIIMACVFMVDKQGLERDRYKTVIKLDMVLLVALLIFWGPFFYSLLTQ